MAVGNLSEIERLTPKLRRYARGLVGRTAIADDLVQDALLSALRSKGMGSGQALLLRLYAIITDFNRLRMSDQNGQDDYVTEPRSAVIALRHPSGQPLEMPKSTAPHRRDPLAAMTLEEREAILLVAVEGLDYVAAAGVAGISPLALMARLASARGRAAMTIAAPADRQTFRPTAHRHLQVVS